MEAELFIWAIVFALFVVAEVTTVQLVSIWFAVGALCALLSAYFFNVGFIAQFAIFTLSSGIFLAFTFPFLSKWRKNRVPVSTNAELDIGETAVVIEEINENTGSGRVTLKGVDWSAVPAVSGTVIPKDSIVIVKKVQGAKLTVVLK
ncbi:MAG: NfeD family protein [Ruminococcus sp.]|nr:NfeD family protein [Ruminococcus sp.]